MPDRGRPGTDRQERADPRARGLPEDEIAPRSAAGSSMLGERDIRRLHSALEVYLEEHNSLDLLIGASGRRVVISTAGDPSQDAELVINR